MNNQLKIDSEDIFKSELTTSLYDQHAGAKENKVSFLEILKEMTSIMINLNDSVKLLQSQSKTSAIVNTEKQIESLYQKQERKSNEINNIKHDNTLTIDINKGQVSDLQQLTKPTININKNKTIITGIKAVRIANPLELLKNEVERAKNRKKTFTVIGQYPSIRKALINRGWIEKLHPGNKADNVVELEQMQISQLMDLHKNKNNKSQTIAMVARSKLLGNHQVDLYWSPNRHNAFNACSDQNKLTLINYLGRRPSGYTSKQGICQILREAHWLRVPGFAEISHPRCYILDKETDMRQFLKDFRLTAAVSLLKWIAQTAITGQCKIISKDGMISIKYFDFAIIECYKFLKKLKHQDLDEKILEASDNEWRVFIEEINKVIFKGNHFKLNNNAGASLFVVMNEMANKSNYILNQLFEYLPHMYLDGYRNIWIVKPTNSNRGQGIHICKTVDNVTTVVKKNPNRRYIVQKYIENPLLIYNTKFDIRQWFLITNTNQLSIWMYRRCYLRFSSQMYNLRNLHESIHLTNNSVQAKYQNLRCSKDPLIPACGMWTSSQFKTYLKDIGFPTVFEDTIYPEMKQSIIGVIMAFKDKTDCKRKNSFEVYGADFILAEDFKPWLLEINSNPAIHASTPVTSKMCPQMLEDVIKVIIDYKKNTAANTGDFELIYKENLTDSIVNMNPKLEISVIPASKKYFSDDNIFADTSHIKPFKDLKELTDTNQTLLQIGQNMKNIMKKLLKILKQQRKIGQQERNASN